MDLWKAGDEVLASVKDLIAKYHPHLALCDDEIAVLFKEKGSAVGDNVVMGKTAKASPLISLLADKPYKFVITLAQDQWEQLNDSQKVALLDHHLCACQAEENEHGDIKFWVQPPDVEFYQAEIERHGFWRTGSASPVAKNVLEELFGKAVAE